MSRLFQLLPLRDAVLCVQCETISVSSGECETCGSRALLSLARVLNRDTETEETAILERMFRDFEQMKRTA